MTELELRAKNGDRDAFSQLVEENQKRVYNLALRIVGVELAEDAAQEAFLRAWRGRESFQGESSFTGWLYQVTRNTCIDLLRRKGVSEGGGLVSLEGDEDEPALQLPDPAPGPQERTEQAERARVIRQALNRLPPDKRNPLVLRALDGLSYQEIGDVMGLPVGTVRSRIARARLALRKVLQEDGNFSELFPSLQTEREKGGRRE